MIEENKETKEIVTTSKNPALSKPLPLGEEANTMFKWAAILAKTKYYEGIVKAGGENALAAILLTARDLDISASQAINSGVYIVNGKVQLSAQIMNMLVRRKGHSIVKLKSDDKVCIWKGIRKDNGDTMTSTFTIEDAQKAGLLKNAVWKSFTTRMLSNRAFSFLAKELFSDCIGNSHIEGEIETIDITESSADNAEPMNEETLQFIRKFDIDNKESKASTFIDYIAERTKESRSNTIVNTSKDQVAFEANLKKFEKK